MLPLRLDQKSPGFLSILCIGAHCDDIEIGCGGTLLRLLERYQDACCRWVVFSGDDNREQECMASAEHFLNGARDRQVKVLRFRDGFFPYVGGEIKDEFERIRRDWSPDLIFTHTLDDRHQDHRLLADLTWNTFRDHLILEYEIPKYDGDVGRPNVFVALEGRHVERKIEILLESYETQRAKRWFRAETFEAVMRLRGMEAAAECGLAEAFYGRKALLEI